LLTDKENVDAALNVFFKSIGFSGATARGKAEVEDFVEHLSHDVPLIKETLKHQEKTLSQTTKQNISLHINNIFKEGKLDREATVKEYLTVQQEVKDLSGVR
jgi:hypothetical protein